MDSFAKLLRGYEKFRQNLNESEVEHFRSLENGQKPETLMITCSDSRVDPGLFYRRYSGRAVCFEECRKCCALSS